MAERRGFRGFEAGCLSAALLALTVLPAAAASQATEGSPFMMITRWQAEKLGGTEFSTHPIQKVGEQYFLVRRVKPGELFSRLVQRYCDSAGIDADRCKEVVKLAQEHHDRDHWHKNWQENDAVFLEVPREVYEPKTPGR